jgi:hypothetical protein
VATVPRDDAYVDAVLPLGALHVGEDAVPSPWLDPAVLTRRAGEIDVLHVHAGLGHRLPGELECWTESVRRTGVPLVVTVHELHPPDPGEDARLAALLSTAEVVLTPTAAAADEIGDRFGRTAIVVAYPSLDAPDPELGAERGLVGLRLGPSSSAVPDQVALVRAALSGAVSGGGRLRVLAEAAHDPGPAVWQLARSGDVELVVHPAGERAAQLQQLHAAVLPERCGTHSRDLETCRDVGTRVVAPRCGWSAGQWSEVVTYGVDERGGADPVSLTGAVAAALTTPMPRPADRVWRGEQRAAVVRVHAEVYAKVAADRVWQENP